MSETEKEILTTEDTEEHGGNENDFYVFLRVLCVLRGESLFVSNH